MVGVRRAAHVKRITQDCFDRLLSKQSFFVPASVFPILCHFTALYPQENRKAAHAVIVMGGFRPLIKQALMRSKI